MSEFRIFSIAFCAIMGVIAALMNHTTVLGEPRDGLIGVLSVCLTFACLAVAIFGKAKA